MGFSGTYSLYIHLTGFLMSYHGDFAHGTYENSKSGPIISDHPTTQVFLLKKLEKFWKGPNLRNKKIPIQFCNVFFLIRYFCSLLSLFPQKSVPTVFFLNRRTCRKKSPKRSFRVVSCNCLQRRCSRRRGASWSLRGCWFWCRTVGSGWSCCEATDTGDASSWGAVVSVHRLGLRESDVFFFLWGWGGWIGGKGVVVNRRCFFTF